MKKFLCTLLSILLCVSAALPSLAAEADGEEIGRLILLAKEKLDIDDSLVEFRNYYMSEDEGSKTYRLYWESKDENVSRDVQATIDEDGFISRYYIYEKRDSDKPGFAKFSKEEAIAAARNFIAKVAPDKLSSLSEGQAERGYDGDYSVTFDRLYRNIPVSGNQLCFSVRSDTLQIVSYYADWQELSFDEGTPVSEEAAREAFAEEMGYQLFYQVRSEDYESKAHLVYRSRYDENVMLDALTGEAVNYEELYTLYRGDTNAKNEAAMDFSAGGSSASLSAVEQALMEQVSQMLSKEKADSLSRAVKEFGLTSDFTIERYSVSRAQDGSYKIFIDYQKAADEKEQKTTYKRVGLQAETGLVTSYLSAVYEADSGRKQAELPRETLLKKADAFLERYYSDYYRQMQLREIFTEQGSSFEFCRLVNGIPVYNNGAALQYDSQSGELTYFSLDWTEADFPSAGTACEPAAANQRAMEKDNFALRYVPVPAEEGMRGMLVYSLAERPVLAADSLRTLDYRLQPEKEEKIPVYTDLEGHYSAARIEKLLENDIYLSADSEGRLRPEEAITQQDFFLLLDTVIWKRGFSADTESMYQYLVRRNILTAEEAAPEAAVSRIDGMTYLLRALGYGDFVTIPGIFRCHFTDIQAENEGVAAVAYGLGLAAGENGLFYPEENLRRADAMIIVYNYLAR